MPNSSGVERVEYRVVGEGRRTGHRWQGDPRDAPPKLGHLTSLRSLNNNVRVQKRTVTESPWVDVAEGDQG